MHKKDKRFAPTTGCPDDRPHPHLYFFTDAFILKSLRKLLCWLLGHRSICLGHFAVVLPDSPYYPRSYYTHWKCERCEHTFQEQWDM